MDQAHPLVVLAWYVDGTPKIVPDAFFRDGGIERVEYIVTYDTRRTRKWQCTCPHAVYRKVTCKHILRCQPDLPAWLAVFQWARDRPSP